MKKRNCSCKLISAFQPFDFILGYWMLVVWILPSLYIRWVGRLRRLSQLHVSWSREEAGLFGIAGRFSMTEVRYNAIQIQTFNLEDSSHLAITLTIMDKFPRIGVMVGRS